MNNTRKLLNITLFCMFFVLLSSFVSAEYTNNYYCNCINCVPGTVYVCNGTSGYSIAGTKFFLWSNYTGSPNVISYNGTTTVAMFDAVGGNKIPFDDESENSAGYLPESVYSSAMASVYDFHDTGTLRDKTANNVDSTSWSGPLTGTSYGVFDYGAYFDGSNDYMQIGSYSFNYLHSANDFTFMGWVKHTTTAAGSIFGNTIGGDRAGTIFHVNKGTNYSHLYGARPTTWPSYLIRAYEIDAAEWHHYAYTGNHSGDVYRLYVDGVLFNETPRTNAVPGGNSYYASMQFGRQKPASSYGWWGGQVDQFMFFNGDALSQEEVVSFYNYTAWTVSSVASVEHEIGWTTSGGFIDDTLTYNQVMSQFTTNITYTDLSGSATYITVSSPTTVDINNQTMTCDTNTTFRTCQYNTSLLLDEVGDWNVSITTVVGGVPTTNNRTFSVDVTTQNLLTGYYGYRFEGVPSNASILDIAGYDVEMIDIRTNASEISTNWESIKRAIEKANELNVKVGLSYQIDWNMSSTSATGNASRDYYISNATSKFSELLSTPYLESIVYLKYDVESAGYSDADKSTNTLNVISPDVFATTNNYFSIVTEYNNTLLNTDYMQTTDTLIYVTNAGIEGNLINTLANLTRSVETLTRIYYDLNSSEKSIAQTYFTNIIKPLPSTINVSTAINALEVSELVNGYLLVYNNLSTTQNITLNVENGTRIGGYDIWDFTGDILLESNSDGIITFLDIPGYEAHLIGGEEINHIKLDNPNLVITLSSPVESNRNFTDGTRDNANDAATKRAVELWDSDYIDMNTAIYYGWLNSSGIVNPYAFDGLHYLIIADKNDAEIDKLFNGSATIDYVFGYVAVADYNDSDPNWLNGKKAEVDAWLALNGSLNIFLDGLDAASIVNATQFAIDVRNLTDYVKITKLRELGINVFTEYQEFAQLSSANGFAMKESCSGRWQYANGVDDTNGYNYSNQYWSDFGGYGDFNKSIWYNLHDINLVCVPFVWRNDTAFVPNSTDYAELQKHYIKAKILGYDYVAITTPIFNILYNDKFINMGEKLQRQATQDNDLFYMRYSNGIAYYNETSDVATWSDGRIVHNSRIDLNLYDNAAYNYNVCINKYCDWTVTTPGDGFSYDDYVIEFNSTVLNSSNGHYVVSVQSLDGGYIGTDTDVNTYGKHSFYDNSGSWAIEATASGNDLIGIRINDSISATIDTTNKITQTDTDNSNVVSSVVAADYDFNVTIFTMSNTVNDTINGIQVYNGSEYIFINNFTYSTNCEREDITFSLNTVPGLNQKIGVCVNNVTNTARYDIQFVDKSEDVTIRTISDYIPPSIDIASNYTFFENESVIGFLTISDAVVDVDTISINDSNFKINSSGALENNTVLSAGVYAVTVTANDTLGNAGSGIVYITMLPEASATVNLESPGNNTITTISAFTFDFNVSSNTNITFCSLMVDDVIRTNKSISFKTDFSESLNQSLTNGNYNWSVQCSDEYTNTFSSPTYFITLEPNFNITTCAALQGIAGNKSGDYQLMNDIDCAGYPISQISGEFNGTLNGNSYTIKNVNINSSLFGTVVTEAYNEFYNFTLANWTGTGGYFITTLGAGSYMNDINFNNFEFNTSSSAGIIGITGQSTKQIHIKNINATDIEINSLGVARYTGGFIGRVQSGYDFSNFYFNNITIYNTGASGQSIAGAVVGAFTGVGNVSDSVDNVNVYNANVTCVLARCGIFSGDYNKNSGYVINITNSHFGGTADATTAVGGILGINNDPIAFYVTNTSVDAALTASTTATGGILGQHAVTGSGDYYFDRVSVNANNRGVNWHGGFIGYGASTITSINIIDSYSTGKIHASGAIGGLVGYVRVSNINITNSYSSMNLTYSTNGTTKAGLVAWTYGVVSNVNITNSFYSGYINDSLTYASTAGGLFGNQQAGGTLTIKNSYWINASSGPENCTGSPAGNTGCTVQDTESYYYDSLNAPLSSFDFENVWVEQANDFPILGIAPSVTVTSPTNSTYTTNTILINFTASDDDGIDTLWYYNGTNNVIYTTPVNITVADANHTFIFYANDTNGDIGHKVVNFIVDGNAPTITVTSPQTTLYNTNTILVNFTATDISGVDSLWYYNKTANVTYTVPVNVTLDGGSHTFKFYANDTLGNTAAQSVTFNISDTNINTCAELEAIRYNLTADYQLMNDIDCTGYSFTQIPGTFSGTLNGNGYSIINWSDDTSMFFDINTDDYNEFYNFTIDGATLNLSAAATYGAIIAGKIDNNDGQATYMNDITIKNSIVNNSAGVDGDDVGFLVGDVTGDSLYLNNINIVNNTANKIQSAVLALPSGAASLSATINTSLNNIVISGNNFTVLRYAGLVSGQFRSGSNVPHYYTFTNIEITDNYVNALAQSVGGIVGYAPVEDVDNLVIDNVDIDNLTIDAVNQKISFMIGDLAGDNGAPQPNITITNININNSQINGGTASIGGVIGIINTNYDGSFILDRVNVSNSVLSSTGSVGSIIANNNLDKSGNKVTNVIVTNTTVISTGTTASGISSTGTKMLYENVSLFQGNVTSGTGRAGGFGGWMAPSDSVFNNIAINAIIDCNNAIDCGGFGGRIGGTNNTFNNTYFTGSIINGGTNSTGGFFGVYRSGDNSIHNSYTNFVYTDNDASSDGLGGVIGKIDSTTFSSNSVLTLNNVFVYMNTTETPITSGLLIAYNQSSNGYNMSYSISNLYASNSSNTATNWVGNEPSNTPSGVNVQDTESYYYEATNAPLSSWDFQTVWAQQADDFPVFGIGPDVNVTEPINGTVYASNTIVINFTASDADGIDDLWYYNGTHYVIYTAPVLDLKIEAGNHTFIFYANDTNGYIGHEVVVFTVDKSSPNITNLRNITINITDSLSEQFNATTLSTIANWTVSATGNIDITNNGLLYNTSWLNASVYSVNMSVNDTNGFTTNTNLTVTVLDNVAPVFTTVANITTNASLGVGQTFVAYDSVGVVDYYLNDTTEVDINSAGYIYNTTKLSVGTTYYTVYANDSAGNVGSATFWITVTNIGPVMQTVRTTPVNVYDFTDVSGLANATDYDEQDLIYYYEWYKNDVLNTSGQEGTTSAICYQETANVSTACGGLNTGAYSYSSFSTDKFGAPPSDAWFDGNYGTGITRYYNTSETTAYLFTNYTVPSNTQSAILQMALENGTIVNSTIDSQCVAQSTLQIRYREFDGICAGGCLMYVECYNGTGWNEWDSSLTEEFGLPISGFNPFYEEGIYWNLTSYAQGIEVNLSTLNSTNFDGGDTWLFSVSTGDGYSNTSWMNSTPFTVISSAPGMNTSRITPQPLYENDTNMYGYCNGTDINDSSVGYYYRWYKNGVLNASGNTSIPTATQGVETLVSTVSYSLIPYQNYTFSCLATDGGMNSSWLNSSTVMVNDVYPVIDAAYFTPDAPNSSAKIYAHCNTSGYGNFNITWVTYKNDALFSSGSTSASPGHTQVTSVLAANLSGDDKWDIQCQVSDEYNSTAAINGTTYILSTPPTITEFTGPQTTDFSAVANISAVTGLTLENNDGFINVTGPVDADKEDYDANVEIGYTYIAVNTSNLDTSFNSTAVLKFENATCPYTVYYYPDYSESKSTIMSSGQVCNATTTPACTPDPVCYPDGSVYVTVNSFSSYAVSGTSQLSIWTVYNESYEYANVQYYANYTGLDNNTVVNETCEIYFNDTASYHNMTYNFTSGLYRYNRSYAAGGWYTYNVSCSDSTLTYTPVATNDSLYMRTMPSIVTVAISPTTVYETSVMSVLLNATDIDGDNIQPGIIWYKNGAVNTTDSDLVNYTQGVLHNLTVFNITVPNLIADESWIASLRVYSHADGGYWTAYTNSSSVKVSGLEGPVVNIINANTTFKTDNSSIISLYNYSTINIGVQYNHTDLKNATITIDCETDGNIYSYSNSSMVAPEYNKTATISLPANMQKCVFNTTAFNNANFSTTIAYEFHLGGTMIIGYGNNTYDGSNIANVNVTVTPLSGQFGPAKTVELLGSYRQIQNLTPGRYRIDITSPYYFDRTVSKNLSATSYNHTWNSSESTVNVSILNVATGLLLDNFTFTITNSDSGLVTVVNSTTYTSVKLPINATTYTYNVSRYPYFDISGNFTTSYKENKFLQLQMSFNATFNLYDERTLGAFNISSPDTINFLLECPNSTYTTVITSTVASIPITCAYETFTFRLEYGTSSYYRTFILLPDEALDIDIYLIDLLTTSALYNSFQIDDLLNEYDDVAIVVKKNIGNQTVQITGDYVDIENKIGAYLIENNEYIIEIRSSNKPTRIMGTYSADQEGNKALRLYDIGTGLEYTGDVNSISVAAAVMNFSTIKYAIASFKDVENTIVSNQIELFYDEISNATRFLLVTYTNSTANNYELQFPLNGTAYENKTLYAKITAVTDSGNIVRFSQQIQTEKERLERLDVLFEFFDEDTIEWAVIIILSIFAIMGTMATRNMVNLGFLGLAGLFMYMGLFEWTGITLALAIIFVLVSAVRSQIGGDVRR